MEDTIHDHDMMLEEFDRITVLDAAINLRDQLKHPDSAIVALLSQARDDAHVAVRELVFCDPNDTNAIRELQWRVTRFEALHGYIGGIVEAARSMTDDMTEEQLAETERLLSRGEPEVKD